jgi:hypothetical protein
MKFIIKGYDPALRWDCQYKEITEFDSLDEATEYCKELFADDIYSLEAAEE